MKGWRDVPVRRLFRVVNGGTPTSDVDNWNGNIPWATPVDLGRCNGGLITSTARTLTKEGLRTGSASVPAGSLVMSTRAPIGYVAQSVSKLAFNQGCRGLVPSSPVDIRYYRYTFTSMSAGLQSRGQGSTFSELSSEALAAMPLPLPSPRVQRAIADFLDAETARIDALITKKRELADLLEVRWQVMVRAVALSSGGPLVPLRRLWTVTDCKHRTPTYVEDGFPVVSPGDVTAGRLDLRQCHRFVSAVDFADLTEGGRRPHRGDIVYSRNASIGIAAYVETDEPFTMGQDVCLIRSQMEDQLWMTYMLNSVGVDQLAEMKIGSTFDRVNISQLLDLQLPAPPPDVQRFEAQRLDEERQRVDRLHSSLQAQITLLRERRQALITAAVTGELELPGVAA